MIKLATYILLELAAIGCLVSAFLLTSSTSETAFVGLAGGAGMASLGMVTLLAFEVVRSRRVEKSLCFRRTTTRSTNYVGPHRQSH
jgi:hypothetical protein